MWKVKPDKPAEFDVYLDYACADDSAGNLFAIDGVEPAIRGKVAGTSGWDRYAPETRHSEVARGSRANYVRPDAPVRNALLDLRTLYLVPVGEAEVREARAAKDAY